MQQSLVQGGTAMTEDHPLLDPSLRTPIENLVSSHLGRSWRISLIEDKNDLASHPCAILSDGQYGVFVKMSADDCGYDQFSKERLGLRYLTDQAGVLTPRHLGVLCAAGDVTMAVLEAVDVVPRRETQWREIGRCLAQIHCIKGSYCGLDHHTYFGPLKQDNTQTKEWAEFYAARRLLPWLDFAAQSGYLTAQLGGKVERLIARLPALCGDPIQPALLHGDAQQNNFISTGAGPVVIDVAVYYGHPEMDLAHVDFFDTVPEALFAGYREIAPIDKEFQQRRDLWRVGTLLGLVGLGEPYAHHLAAVVAKFT